MIPECVDCTALLSWDMWSHSAWSAKHLMICFFVLFLSCHHLICANTDEKEEEELHLLKFLFLKKFFLCSARNLFHLIPTLRVLSGKVGTFLATLEFLQK